MESRRAITVCLQPCLLCTDFPNRYALSPYCMLIFQVFCLDWIYCVVPAKFISIHYETFNNKDIKSEFMK